MISQIKLKHAKTGFAQARKEVSHQDGKFEWCGRCRPWTALTSSTWGSRGERTDETWRIVGWVRAASRWMPARPNLNGALQAHGVRGVGSLLLAILAMPRKCPILSFW